MDTKICAKCDTSKPLKDFQRTKAGNHSGTCCDCIRAASKERNRRWRKENQGRKQEDNRQYRAQHPQYFRIWKANQSEEYHQKERQRQADYSKVHPERRREANRKYYANNKERINKKTPNPETRRGINHRRRARQANATIGDVRPLSQMIAEQGGKCYLCGERFTKKRPATLEHYIPLARGGEHSNNNTMAAHGYCNQSKGAALPEEFAQRKQRLLI